MQASITTPGRPEAMQGEFQKLFHALNAGDEPIVEDNGSTALRPGVVYLANDSRFVETHYDEPLTTYIVGWRDPHNIEQALEFFAPRTPVPRRFTYKSASNAEEFYSETDDRRAIGSSFKRVEYTGSEVEARTYAKGLMAVLDRDELTPGGEQRLAGRLLRRIKRNELRRAVALLSAAATNTAKTWDTTAGKDPDQDVLSELVTAETASGVGVNRIGYGHTAWVKRGLSHRAQVTAGGFASAMMTPDQVAGIFGVDQVYVSKERFQNTSTAKAEIVNNLVLMFHAEPDAFVDDPSNIKRFVSLTDQGGDMAVYQWDIGPRLIGVAVAHYSNIAITSTLGIRKFTVS